MNETDLSLLTWLIYHGYRIDIKQSNTFIPSLNTYPSSKRTNQLNFNLFE